jgi:hypothetical protein
MIFYTTHTFDLRQQIKNVQSTEGFFSDATGDGAAVKDPLWSGTHVVGNKVSYIGPPSSRGRRGFPRCTIIPSL